MKYTRFLLFLFLLFFTGTSAVINAQNSSVSIARLQYSGGGDWYANPTSLPNLISFCNENLGTGIAPREVTVEAGNRDIFNYPFIHMTGHGNVVFSDAEAENLRNYLTGGGFLHIDDNYGMDVFIRTELKKVFPNHELIELPSNHPVFHQKYTFQNGLPKIHQHDEKPAQAFGIIHEGRLVLLYSYQSDLGDGWEDPDVHDDPEEVRQKALQMGANIVSYVFMGE
ncbi:MAG: DUF4159 domain-containing protein [Bacteroidia bacterium]